MDPTRELVDAFDGVADGVVDGRVDGAVGGDLSAHARLHRGVQLLLRGELVRAVEDLRAAARVARLSGVEPVLRAACGHLALAHALQGDLVVAQHWLDQLDGATPAEGLEEVSGTGAVVARALVALGRLDLEAAGTALSALAWIGDPVLRDELWGFVAYARCELAVLRGDRTAALHALDAAVAAHASTCRPGAFVPDLLLGARVDLLAALGDGNRARAVLDEQQGLSLLLRVRRARVDLLIGDVVAARTHAVRVGAVSTSTRHRVQALLVEAVAEQRLGQGADAAVAATRAAELAHAQGLLQPFAQVPLAELRHVAAGAPVPGGPTWHAVGLLREVLEEPVLGVVGEAMPTTLTVVELTERERAVLGELASTPSLDVVAARLFVSTNTVKTQVRSLYRKLGVHNRDDAVVAAYRSGLLRD